MSIPVKSAWTGNIYLWDKVVAESGCLNIITLDFKNGWQLWSSLWYKLWWTIWFESWQWWYCYSTSWMYWWAIKLPDSIFNWKELLKVELDVYRINNIWLWLDINSSYTWGYPWCFRYSNWRWSSYIWYADWIFTQTAQHVWTIEWEFTISMNIETNRIYWNVKNTAYDITSNYAQDLKNAWTAWTLWFHCWMRNSNSTKSYIRKAVFYTK